MGIARISRHHNTSAIAFRTQNITSTKNFPAASEAASQLFINKEIAFV
jgi:hypothetical protein